MKKFERFFWKLLTHSPKEKKMIKSRSALMFVLSPFLFAITFFIGGCCTHHENCPGDYLNSSAITFKVKENLMRDPKVNSAHISVTTYKDTVTLSGYVHNERQERRAIYIARHVKGVRYVVDNLVITDEE